MECWRLFECSWKEGIAFAHQAPQSWTEKVPPLATSSSSIINSLERVSPGNCDFIQMFKLSERMIELMNSCLNFCFSFPTLVISKKVNADSNTASFSNALVPRAFPYFIHSIPSSVYGYRPTFPIILSKGRGNGHNLSCTACLASWANAWSSYRNGRGNRAFLIRSWYCDCCRF